LDVDDFLTETPTEDVPAIVSSLIAGALASFDADRNTSRRYLIRASAILQACVAHEAENGRQGRPRGGLARWQVNRLVDYIEEHLAERITGEDLATLIDVSVGQLFRAFKASVGIPPLQYVLSRRLELACSLLRTSREPLSQIALTAGFCDQSHLCRVFRRVLGVTPATWRRANAADPETVSGRRFESIAMRQSSDLFAYPIDECRSRPAGENIRPAYARSSPGELDADSVGREVKA
jgi:AraC family transcriptional regulator